MNSFGKVTDVVIEALAKNCTALTTVYVESRQGHGCGHRGLGQEVHFIDDSVYLNSLVKVTDVVIEALA